MINRTGIINCCRDFLKNPWQKRYAGPLLLINALGSVYGYYWYAGQINETPFKYLVFVPDSPLATSLFSLALTMHLLRIRSTPVYVLACAACIKYGLWADIVITHFWVTGGPVRPSEVMLWVSHLGMAVEGLIYLFNIRVTGVSCIIGMSWFLLNDILDYYLGIYPYLYRDDQLLIAGISALCLSLALFALLWRRWLSGVRR